MYRDEVGSESARLKASFQLRPIPMSSLHIPLCLFSAVLQRWRTFHLTGNLFIVAKNFIAQIGQSKFEHLNEPVILCIL